eukprot:gene11236-biopygen18383
MPFHVAAGGGGGAPEEEEEQRPLKPGRRCELPRVPGITGSAAFAVPGGPGMVQQHLFAKIGIRSPRRSGLPGQRRRRRRRRKGEEDGG